MEKQNFCPGVEIARLAPKKIPMRVCLFIDSERWPNMYLTQGLLYKLIVKDVLDLISKLNKTV